MCTSYQSYFGIRLGNLLEKDMGQSNLAVRSRKKVKDKKLESPKWGRLKVLNDTKLVLNQHELVCDHSEASSDVPYSPNQSLARPFFVASYSKTALVREFSCLTFCFLHFIMNQFCRHQFRNFVRMVFSYLNKFLAFILL